MTILLYSELNIVLPTTEQNTEEWNVAGVIKGTKELLSKERFFDIVLMQKFP